MMLHTIYQLICLFLLLTSLFVYLYFRCQPPKHLKSLPRDNSFKQVYHFIKLPILEAIRTNYWSILFDKGHMLGWYLGNWWVIISDSEEIKTLFYEPGLCEKILFSELNSEALIVDYMGNNVLYSKSEEWKRHRQLVNPSFKYQIPIKLFIDCAMELIDVLTIENQYSTKYNVNDNYEYKDEMKSLIMGNYEGADIHKHLSGMTLNALGLAIFGFNFDALRNPDLGYTQLYHRAANAASNNLYFLFPFLERLPIPSRARDRSAVRDFRGLVKRFLMEKRKEIANKNYLKIEKSLPEKNMENDNDVEEGKKDLLTRMIEATGEKSSTTLSDIELINNTVVLFAAGHDTSANTLSFALYHLSTNIYAQQKAREEIQMVLGIGKDIVAPTNDQLNQMVYLEAVVYETMRKTPTLPQMRRQLQKPYNLKNGTHLRKGTLVILQVYTSMNDPKHWKDPEQFLPNRFLTFDEEEKQDRIDGKAMKDFYGFGGGTRICVGSKMAMLEQKVALCLILQKFSVELPENSKHKEGLITSKDQVCRPVDLKLKFNKL